MLKLFSLRDPKGIYNSVKNRKSTCYPDDSLKIWTQWYSQTMKKYNEYKSLIPKKYKKNILEIKFEDFVLNYEKNKRDS